MLFISHSSKDEPVVRALVDLFRAALPLAPDKIRCSTLEGYRLPGGADIDTHLKHEVPSATVFVGLISPHSLRSEYVSFEFGARWGAGKTIIPLLAPGVAPTFLEGPLARLAALSCESGSQLHQLVSEVGSALGVTPYGPHAYEREVERIRLLPPVPALILPAYVATEVALNWPTRRLRLPDSQREILEYLEAESRRRDSLPQQDLEERFGVRVKSIYWRMEVLCCFGFTEKAVTSFRGATPTFNYRLSDEYRAWLGTQP
jgi:TIR domain